MPSFSASLTTEQIRDVSTYVVERLTAATPTAVLKDHEGCALTKDTKRGFPLRDLRAIAPATSWFLRKSDRTLELSNLRTEASRLTEEPGSYGSRRSQ